jgi:5'-deoxynucleotidase YfbR-like HD superfamily hydrolase
MKTITGKFVDFENKTVEVCIEDIAHSLSLQNRFAGHTKRPYNVAHHSIIVSKNVPKEFALWGLLHDSGEAYVGDMIAPIKSEYIKNLEESFLALVAKKFGLKLPVPHEVTVADRRVLLTEMNSPEIYNQDVEPFGVEKHLRPYVFQINPLDWFISKQLFLDRFYDLMRSQMDLLKKRELIND